MHSSSCCTAWNLLTCLKSSWRLGCLNRLLVRRGIYCCLSFYLCFIVKHFVILICERCYINKLCLLDCLLAYNTWWEYCWEEDIVSPLQSGFHPSWASECPPQRCTQDDGRWIGQCSRSGQWPKKKEVSHRKDTKDTNTYAITASALLESVYLCQCDCELTMVSSLAEAPCWSSRLMIWVWPCWAAWCRGV